jgi:hypothetical protein
MLLYVVFLPQNIIRDTAADLSRFGDEVLTKKVFDWVSDAERNLPFVRGNVAIHFCFPLLQAGNLILLKDLEEMHLAIERMSL